MAWRQLSVARLLGDCAQPPRHRRIRIVEVTFEANGPKSFDDVVVRYDPAVARSGSERVTADYHQVKWHVEYGGRFGYADLIEPAFIGAKTFSILQRLADARNKAGPGSCFSFITVYRIKDGDQLAELVSANDRSLLVEKLFDGPPIRAGMGAVRKLWREHLALTDDDGLRKVVTGLRIFDGHRSLEELKESDHPAREASRGNHEPRNEFRLPPR